MGEKESETRAMRVPLDRRVVRSWDEALTLAGVPGVPFNQLVVSRRVLRAAAEPTAVDECPDYGAESFRD